MVKAKGGHPDCVNGSNPYHRCADFCFKRSDEAKVVKGSKDSGHPVLYVLENHGGTKENNLHLKMEKERRVQPQCVNASNPFHACGEHCTEKIAESKPRTVRGKSGESVVHKATSKERNVHPDCVNASNPYHACAAYCFDRIAKNQVQMGKKEPDPIFINSFNKSSKKKGGKFQYKPMQVLDGVSVLIKVRSANAPPPPSSLSSSNKKEGLENVEPIHFPQQYYEETPAQEPPFDGNISTNDGLKDVPLVTPLVTPSDIVEDIKCITNTTGAESMKREDDLGDNITTSPPIVGSMSSNISGITVAFDDGDDDDEEEVQSMISDSKVRVGKYYVKESNASVLQSIFDQHGDIAESCVLESVLIRSYYLDCVCSVVRELQSPPFTLLTKSRAKEVSAILNDLESSQINVAWLRHRLDEITEAMELISHHRSIKAAKVNCYQSLEAARKELESQVEDLAQKEKELADAKARVVEMKQRLSELEVESSQLNESYSTIRSKVEKLNLKPMSDAVVM